MLSIKDIDVFTLKIKNGYFYWQVKLKNNITYQIEYSIEKNKTSAGNMSKRKIYFIRKNGKKLIFDKEVKKNFVAFKRPYITNGI